MGLISVTVPLMSPVTALTRSLTPRIWAALGVGALALVWLLAALARRPRAQT